MANSNVTLVLSQGAFVPSKDSIPVVRGDTFSLLNQGSAPAFLFFSPAAASLLSPTPANPFSIPPGGKAEFTLNSSAPAAYSVYVGNNPDQAPHSFSSNVAPAIALMVQFSGETSFPVNQLGTGH